MADEILDVQTEETQEIDNRAEKRIKDLSEKVRLTAEQRDEKDKLLKEHEEKLQSLEKERDFLNNFSDVMGKYPDAASYKDAIKEKVLKGYSVEDATISTLAIEGKYSPLPKEEKVINPAGGSAATITHATGEKTLSEMNRDEKRAKLLEAEKRGDLSVS